MQKFPRVSVVMPIYNRAYCVQNAVRSLIDQEFKDWELIVVDDGSDDKDLLIKKLEKFDDERIRYERLEHSGSISKVRNHGNMIANGDIIVVQDSDDVSLPDRLSEIVKAFDEDETIDVVYHGMIIKMYDDKHDTDARLIKHADPFDMKRLLKEQYIPGQIAYKSYPIRAYPYEDVIEVCDDWMMLLGLALNKCKFKRIDKQLYEYYMLDDSVNVTGEIDGRRKKDTENIIKILKDKYGITATAQMEKHLINENFEKGNIISKETIK